MLGETLVRATQTTLEAGEKAALARKVKTTHPTRVNTTLEEKLETTREEIAVYWTTAAPRKRDTSQFAVVAATGRGLLLQPQQSVVLVLVQVPCYVLASSMAVENPM